MVEHFIMVINRAGNREDSEGWCELIFLGVKKSWGKWVRRVLSADCEP